MKVGMQDIDLGFAVRGESLHHPARPKSRRKGRVDRCRFDFVMERPDDELRTVHCLKQAKGKVQDTEPQTVSHRADNFQLRRTESRDRRNAHRIVNFREIFTTVWKVERYIALDQQLHQLNRGARCQRIPCQQYQVKRQRNDPRKRDIGRQVQVVSQCQVQRADAQAVQKLV